MNEKLSATNQHDTSSIGPIWPPDSTSFDRIRGFYNKGIITDSTELDLVLDTIQTLHTRIEGSQDEPSRISIRAVIDNSLLASTDNSLLTKFGEAVIPLDTAGPRFKKSSIIYLGANHQDRSPDPKDLEKIEQNHEEATKRPPHSAKNMIARIYGEGYSLKTVTPEMWENKDHFLQLVKLYQRFGWDSADVLQLIENPNNTITVAIYNNEIVSAGIAEMIKIDLTRPNESIGSATLRLVELTEAATQSSHQGKGLYSAVATNSMIELAKKSELGDIHGGAVDLIYGECNALNLGVLKAAKSQWRTFSPRGDLDFRGLLLQHVPILGAERSTNYNDLIPAFMGRDTMLEFVQS